MHDPVPLPVERESPLPVRSRTAIAEFLRSESAGAVLLFIATVFALVWANSSHSAVYFAFWRRPVGLNLGGISFAMDLHHWINDGLMSLFFFVVGLEIKRELAKGELSSVRRAALPVIAALGGMLVPAAIYFALNRYGEAARGWGIPMATDIGFALGVLALLGKRIPSSLRVFLLALAIVDDLGAILVIGLFYTQHISVWAIGAALSLLAVLVALSQRVRKTAIYAIVSLAFWLAVLKSGIHASIAGVVLALLVPVGPRYEISEMIPQARRLLERLGLALQRGEEETAEVYIFRWIQFLDLSPSPNLTQQSQVREHIANVLGTDSGLLCGRMFLTQDACQRRDQHQHHRAHENPNRAKRHYSSHD